MSDELAKLLGDRFLERRDVKAVQHSSGIYTPDRTPFSWGDLRAHLEGTKSFGHYLVSPEDKARVFAFDIDLVKALPEGHDGPDFSPREHFANPNSLFRKRLIVDLMCLAEGLARRTQQLFGIPVAMSFSGTKGVHVYGWTGSENAGEVRGAAHDVLKSYDEFEAVRGDNFFAHSQYPTCEVEVFPKQSSLEGKDLGNLMRLALGTNKKSKLRSFFLQPSNVLGEFIEMDPVSALNGKLAW